MFIRITACWLADPLSGLLHQGLRTFHRFHARLGCYRLERKLPGGFNTLPLEFCAFPRRAKTGSYPSLVSPFMAHQSRRNRPRPGSKGQPFEVEETFGKPSGGHEHDGGGAEAQHKPPVEKQVSQAQRERQENRDNHQLPQFHSQVEPE